jgi:hypothetical protein
MKIAFWDIALCSLGVDRRFRGAYCHHNQGDTRRRENLLSHMSSGMLHRVWQSEKTLMTDAVSSTEMFVTSVRIHGATSYSFP